MSRSPTLETPRLRLEPFSQRHLSERYIAWLNDPDVVRFSEQRHRRHSRASVEAYLRSFEGTPHHFWAIVRKAQQPMHVGNINAYVDLPNGVADVGVLIGEKGVWGRGYGGEAWIAVCRFLLEEGGMRKVTGGTLSSNTGMLTIMRRAGMSPDGVRFRHAVVDGQSVDMVHMALFRDDKGAT